MSLRSGLLIVLTLPVAAGSLRAESREGTRAARIIRLIEQLSHDSFSVREAASRGLETVGEQALPLLRAAASNSDASEIRFRAATLVRRIMQAACLSKSTGMKLVMLKEGEFTMGSPPKEADRRDDELQHRVRITRAFLLGAHEVTQDEYREVMAAQPSWFAATGQGKDKVAKQQTSRFPVDSVSWFDAIKFCNRLSKMDGLKDYYVLSDTKRNGDSIVQVSVKVIGGIGYRLPTEAEWEYACRAGTSTPYQLGNRKTSRGGNFQYRSATLYGSRSKIVGKGRTTAVGSYGPNLWGLHDMHGNVAEWSWDWYYKG